MPIWSAVKVSTLLDNVTPKGVPFVAAWVRDFPALSYVGFNTTNMYQSGGTMQRGSVQYTNDTNLKFKAISSIETDMTIGRNEVTWHELWLILEESTLTSSPSAATTFTVDPDTIRYFKVDDVVRIAPDKGSATAIQQTVITNVNTSTDTITVADAVTASSGDRLLKEYNLIQHGTEISRGVETGDATPVTVYFQKFGESVEFDVLDINQTRYFEDAKAYIDGKFKLAMAVVNNNIARTWYSGRNVSGNKSETQGLDHVIATAESSFGPGSAIIDMSGITNPKDKAKKLVQIANYANSAPVYNGNEGPTVFCNHEFITALSEIMVDMSNHFQLSEKAIDFGLTSYSSPYFRNLSFITDQTLNREHPYDSVAYFFPKHLVWFKTPEYYDVDSNGVLVKTQVGRFNVLEIPRNNDDIRKYTMSLRLANIFAWQTFKGAYLKVIGLS